MVFGFGFSLPNVKKIGTTFVPVTLVTESWAGSGLVNGKVPTTGGGTWAALTNTIMNYTAGFAGPNGSFVNSLAFHSATYANARFSGVVYAGATGASQDQPLFIYARADVNNSTAPNCYYITCNSLPTVQITLSKRVAGVNTDLTTVAANTNGTPIGLQVSGSAIKVYVSGVEVINATDTAIAGAGYWGFGLTYGEVGVDTGNSSIGAVTIQTA